MKNSEILQCPKFYSFIPWSGRGLLTVKGGYSFHNEVLTNVTIYINCLQSASALVCGRLHNLICSALWNGDLTKIFDFVCDFYPNIGILLPGNRILAQVSSAQDQYQCQGGS